MGNTITAIILTFNEEKHIERCIKSLDGVCGDILVVDSFSTDATCSMAERLGARVVQHEFQNQAQQFNWAIDNCPIPSEWIWRVDADEYVEEKLALGVKKTLESCPADVNGIYVNKKIIFMGKPLKHGGWYPAQQIKVIRKGYGRSENKPMDEHLVITQGQTISIDGDQTDENLNDLSWWTAKHNNYASREALNMLAMSYGIDNAENEVEPKLFGNGAQRKRWLKIKYARMPLFIRPYCNYLVRYIFMGGFLDFNKKWYVLQCYWYRYLVDAKIYELKKRFNFDDEKIKAYILEHYK